MILRINLTERIDPEHYRDGSEYNVAQIDFRGEHRVRVYATCRTQNKEPADVFARAGFVVLGPLPGDLPDFDPQHFAQHFLAGDPPATSYVVPWGTSSISWKLVDSPTSVILDPDIIPTSGKPDVPKSYLWDPNSYFPHSSVHYVLHGLLISPDDRNVTVVCSKDCIKWLSLNGQKIEGTQLALKAGTNDIRILYLPSVATTSAFNENNYGCYFRVVDSNGERVRDIHFKKPTSAQAGEGVLQERKSPKFAQ